MKHRILTIGLMATLPLAGCAGGAGTRTAGGAAVGAGVGALAGSALGVGVLEGGVIGAVAGGAIGALVKGPIIKNRQYYRDTRGYCYYVDKNGQPVYDGKVRC